MVASERDARFHNPIVHGSRPRLNREAFLRTRRGFRPCRTICSFVPSGNSGFIVSPACMGVTAPEIRSFPEDNRCLQNRTWLPPTSGGSRNCKGACPGFDVRSSRSDPRCHPSEQNLQSLRTRRVPACRIGVLSPRFDAPPAARIHAYRLRETTPDLSGIHA